MTKFKTRLLALLGGVSVLTLVGVAASCDGGKKNDQPGKDDNGSVKKTPKSSNYVESSDRVAVINKSDLLNEQIGKNNIDKSIVLITDSGQIKDQSFNQSSWEALNTIWDQTNGYAKISANQSDGNYENAYNAALNDKMKYWVLSGFGHSFAFPDWIKAEGHKEALEQLGVTVIFVDFSVDASDLDGFNNYYSLQYKVQEPAWIAAKGLSNYFAEKYPNGTPNDRKLTAFGGGSENGVTDFITGYLKGMISYNDLNPNTKVATGNVALNSGFVPNDTMNAVIQNTLNQNGKAILPVAGPATGRVVDALSSANNTTELIVGVDVDQALSYKKLEHQFATSITKNLGQSLYDVLLKVVYNLTVPSLQNFENVKKFKLGFEQNWVGLTNTHVQGADGEALQRAFDKAKEDFKALTPEIKAYISSNKATLNGNEIPAQENLVDELVKLVNK